MGFFSRETDTAKADRLQEELAREKRGLAIIRTREKEKERVQSLKREVKEARSARLRGRSSVGLSPGAKRVREAEKQLLARSKKKVISGLNRKPTRRVVRRKRKTNLTPATLSKPLTVRKRKRVRRRPRYSNLQDLVGF